MSKIDIATICLLSIAPATKIYVPRAPLDAYKSADGWRICFAQIDGLIFYEQTGKTPVNN